MGPAKPETKEAVASTTTDKDLTSFDANTSIKALRVSDEAACRRILRKLHLRWFHVGTTTFQKLLKQVGCPTCVLEWAAEVVETCPTCRTWTRPSPENVASVAISTEFNMQVECDLMFYKKFTILHIVDRCIRWHATVMTSDSLEQEKIWKHSSVTSIRCG